MSTLQKLCKVMPHTPLQGLMMDGIYKVTCMYNSWGMDRIPKNCAHLTIFWNISII
jgi:hypothetical protein